MAINGKYWAWEDLTIWLPTGLALDIMELNYKSTRDVDAVYGQGAAPRGYGRGNWKGEGDLTMKREQYDQLLLYVAAAGKTIYTLPPFAITAFFGDAELGANEDKIKGVKIKSVDKGNKQGDKSLDVKLAFEIVEDIVENGVSQVSGLKIA